jgi:hypothetical protein
VPSALSEAPIIDARCIGDRELIVPIAGAPALEFTSTVTTSPGQVAVRYFGRRVARGSVAIAIGGVTLVDDSNGNAGADLGLYRDGRLRERRGERGRSTGTSGSATFTAAQAVAIAVAGHTESTPISDRQPRLQLRAQPLAGAGAGVGLASITWHSASGTGWWTTAPAA